MYFYFYKIPTIKIQSPKSQSLITSDISLKYIKKNTLVS